MRRYPIGMMKKRVVFVLLLLLLTNCMQSIVSAPSLLGGDDCLANDVPADWKQYGACYLYDELFVESSYYSSSWISTPLNRIIMNKKLRILSKRGVAFGNIPLPVYTGSPRAFRVTLTGPDGITIPLDNDHLREVYLRKEAIVVPNVTEGCEISVYVEYETYAPITCHEFSFEHVVPVVRARFTFSALSSMEYDFKAYNMAVEALEEEKPGAATGYRYKYHTYELKNVLPRPKLEFVGYVEDDTRWVAVALRKAMGQPVFTDWKSLASQYRQVYLPASGNPAGKKIAKIVADVSRAKKGDNILLADSLLRWIQDRFVITGGGVQPQLSQVIDQEQGTMWDLTLLLRQLYRTAGFPVDIVVTRSRENGGFDSLFVSPQSLSVPVVVVTIDKKEYVAFPFRKGGALGEYPAIFSGNDGLSLSSLQPVVLPQSTAGSCGSSARFTIDCRVDPPVQQVDIALSGAFAYETRTYLRSVEKKEYDEFVQKWLTNLGTSNALDSCSIEGIHEAGGPLRIHATFSNPNQIVRKNGDLFIKTSTLFDTYYKSYDTLRIEPFVTVRSVDDTESVEIIADNADVAHTFECRDITNTLFTMQCDERVAGDTTTLQRVTHINPVRLDRVAMKELYPEILAGNRISESGISVVRGGRSSAGRRKESPRKPAPVRKQ